MAVLGIITCEILELEFAHLLSMDPDISRITVVEDFTSLGFIDALESMGRLRPLRIPLLRGCDVESSDRLEVVVRVLELALHNRKCILQEGLAKAVKETAPYVDGIVLGYGLCGNALQDIDGLLVKPGVPIFLPMDEDHPVDDCVGLIIGGRERYYAEQCKEAGTFFMIPGWTKHWRGIFDKEYGRVDLKMARRLFSGYKRSLLIPTEVMSRDKMEQNIEEFNEQFGFRIEVREGTMDILNATWKNAKRFLA
jgi:hypothetical protein